MSTIAQRVFASALRKYKATRVNANGYVSMGNVHAFERTSSWSCSIWFRRNNTTASFLICKEVNSGNFTGWGLGVSTTNVFWRIGFGLTVGQAAQIDTTLSPVPASPHWYHVAASYNGSSNTSGMKIYVNGALATTSSTNNTLASSVVAAGAFTIGGRDATGSLVADVQDAGMFTGVLSAGDVTALYNKGVPPDMLSLSLSVGAPLGYWLLGRHVGDTSLNSGETSGATVPDLGSGAHNGTMVNGALVTRVSN